MRKKRLTLTAILSAASITATAQEQAQISPETTPAAEKETTPELIPTPTEKKEIKPPQAKQTTVTELQPETTPQESKKETPSTLENITPPKATETVKEAPEVEQVQEVEQAAEIAHQLSSAKTDTSRATGTATRPKHSLWNSP